MHKLIVFFFVIFFGLAPCAIAAVDLTVTPIEGGSTIRFGRITDPARSNKEVRIRVTSDVNKQYQIFQRILTPLVNERGESLDRDVIQVSGLAGSNGSGTIHVQGIDRVGFADQLVYTSSAAGTSDSFILIYEIDPEKVTKSGQFIGKLLYTVRPIGGGNQDEVVINLFLEASGEFDVRVSGSHGLNRIELDALGQESSAYAQFDFQESFGTVRIYQELIQPPRSDSFYEIKPDHIYAEVISDQGAGAQIAPQTVLERRRQLVYESDTPQDQVSVLYGFDQDTWKDLKAGMYQGRLRFDIENGSARQFFDMNLEVDVEPVFELIAEQPPEGMKFKRLLPGQDPQYKEILVKVQSNTGEPYTVSQNVATRLTNEKGQQIDASYFTMRQELLPESSGKIEYEDFVSVPTGQSLLFYSNGEGSSAEFKVIYQMRPYRGMEAGDYEASFVYTLGEI